MKPDSNTTAGALAWCRDSRIGVGDPLANARYTGTNSSTTTTSATGEGRDGDRIGVAGSRPLTGLAILIV